MTVEEFFDVVNEDLTSKSSNWKKKIDMKEKEFVKKGWRCTIY
jgi:hypothetical protein